MSKPTSNLADSAFDSLKQRIVDGSYSPNQKLVISSLAREFSVSTIPVREALAKLNAVNLVIYVPNQGYRVAPRISTTHTTNIDKQSSKDKHKSPTTDLPRPIAIKQALAIFSDPWAFAVLEELFFGVRRFDDFQRNLNISRSVLTRRLRHLQEQKIIDRERYSTRPERFEYRLTDRGRDMYPIFVSLQQWGERWLGGGGAEKLTLIHKPCGHKLEIEIACSHCREQVMAVDVRYELTDED